MLHFIKQIVHNDSKSAEKETRKSGIELLRILAACGVVILHYNDGRAFTYVQDESVNQMVLFLVESLCICAVDLFVLISSYFLCKTQYRSLGKIVELYVQIILFKELIYLLSVVLGNETFAMKAVISRLLPNNYFVILYTALYLISPYINIIFQKLSRKEWKRFIVTMLLLFSVWPTIVDLSGEILAKDWFGLSTIGAWGNQQGFNVVNFILMYCVGAYIRYNGIPTIYKKLSYCVIGIVLCTIVIFGWSIVNESLAHNGLRSAWVYHNPIVILLAVCLFVCFSQMDFSNKAINELAKASFTCFLIHGKFLGFIKIDYFVAQHTYIMLAHIVFCSVLIYVVSWIVYKVYYLFTDWLLQPLGKIMIPNTEEKKDIAR